jgi:hypothetical protein
MGENFVGTLPTSSIDEFKEHLLYPNRGFNKAGGVESSDRIKKIGKNIVMSFSTDTSGCGHIRNIWWLTYLNSIYGRTKSFMSTIMPFFYYNHDMLMRTRTLFFPRVYTPGYLVAVRKYKEMQERYKYNMVYDIDDWIWGRETEDPERMNPPYNKGNSSIPIENVKAATEMMRLVNKVSVSTEFIKTFLKTELKFENEVVVLPNCIPAFFWSRPRRKLIEKRIDKPRIIYTGAPSHYSNEKKLLGDFDNGWHEWLIKNIIDNKIHFKVMGGMPWFLEKVKNRIESIPWINCYMYHLGVLDFQPDIGIAPLVPNYFNYCKSDIKHIEYCAAGCVSIGTTFTNGKPSPYDKNLVTIPDNFTPEMIDEVIKGVLEPERFNKIITDQYDMLDNDGRWLESKEYINKLMGIL